MQHLPSLSVLLPISNWENCLDLRVHELLEVLPELTPRFEVVLVDDGSCDESWEVARGLVTCYPQLLAQRHRLPMGRDAALRTALEMARGDILFVRDASCRLNLHELGKLWQRIDRCDFIFGRRVPTRPLTSPAGLATRPTLESFEAHETFQLMRRRAIGRIQWPAASGRSLLAELAGSGLSCETIYLVEPAKPQARAARPSFAPEWLDAVRTNDAELSAGAPRLHRPRPLETAPAAASPR